MDSLKSIWEDLSDRLKSPFIVSFVLSWLAWNWEILYAANHFGPDYSTFDRLYYIKHYISEHFWTTLTLCPFGTAFLGAIIFYFSKSLYLALDSFYENRARIFVIKLIGIAKMVPSSDLEKYFRELESERKENRDKDTIHATLRSHRDDLLNEIGELQNVSANYNALEVRYNTLREQNDRTNNILNSNAIEFPKTLTNIFVGHWVCEYQILDKENDVIIGSEIFLISDVEYRVDGKTIFQIENITFYKQMNFLSFSKKKIANVISYHNVRLQKFNDNLWVGIEDYQNSLIAYVRFYPIGQQPLHYLSALNLDLSDQEDPQATEYRTGKYKELREVRDSINVFIQN